jgi:hypothetical protein
LIVVVMMFTLVLIAGYSFSVTALLGQTSASSTSPQTLACHELLPLAQIGRRTPYCHFSIMVSIGIGIGSQIARKALPNSQGLVFQLMVGGENLPYRVWLPGPMPCTDGIEHGGALFLLILLLAHKINDLERALRVYVIRRRADRTAQR